MEVRCEAGSIYTSPKVAAAGWVNIYQHLVFSAEKVVVVVGSDYLFAHTHETKTSESG